MRKMLQFCLANSSMEGEYRTIYYLAMKYFSFFFLSLLFVFCVVSCRKDACAEVICQNGGACNDGSCKCPIGYTGVSCEIKVNPCFSMGCDTVHSTCQVSASGPTCVCSQGYEGTLCDKTWVEKFFGIYTASEICGGVSEGYSSELIQGTKFNSITIKNFHNKANGSFGSKIVADLVSPYAFIIQPQPMPYDNDVVFVEGTGEISNNYKTIVVNYSLRYTNTPDTILCELQLTK
jgi:hypothetical protein